MPKEVEGENQAALDTDLSLSALFKVEGGAGLHVNWLAGSLGHANGKFPLCREATLGLSLYRCAT